MTKSLFHFGRCKQKLSNYEGYAVTIGLTSHINKEPKNDEYQSVTFWLTMSLQKKRKRTEKRKYSTKGDKKGTIKFHYFLLVRT